MSVGFPSCEIFHDNFSWMLGLSPSGKISTSCVKKDAHFPEFACDWRFLWRCRFPLPSLFRGPEATLANCSTAREEIPLLRVHSESDFCRNTTRGDAKRQSRGKVSLPDLPIQLTDWDPSLRYSEQRDVTWKAKVSDKGGKKCCLFLFSR
ncbi:hypothetical protein TNIN_219791 [Trichonephila inaurata madagascariensis]|uniref:Uncharacterized protein n=1 Tax=Trichonephila inaurata madagascariensis TaxID=2747483 RepID=A0A8X7CAR4_9ARAC|nr:hypothetical protein TNIN_219791 [Trichonephila inaurata madagascariensis]